MNKIIFNLTLITASFSLIGSNPEPSLTGKRKQPEAELVSTTGSSTSSTCPASPSKLERIGEEIEDSQALPVVPGPEIITIETSDNQELQWPKSIWSLSKTIRKFIRDLPDATKIPLNVTLAQLNYIRQLLKSSEEQIIAQLDSLKSLKEFNTIYELSDYLHIPIILKGISAFARKKGSEIAHGLNFILSSEEQGQKTQKFLNLLRDFKKYNNLFQESTSDELVRFYTQTTNFKSLAAYSLDRIMTPSLMISSINGYEITFNKNGSKVLLVRSSNYLPNDIYVWDLYPTPTLQSHLPINYPFISQAALNFEKNDEEIWLSTRNNLRIFSIAGEEKTHITHRGAKIVDYDFKNNQFVIRYNSDPNNIAVKNILNKKINATPEYIKQFSYGLNTQPNKHPFLTISEATLSDNVISYQLKDESSQTSTAHQITLPFNVTYPVTNPEVKILVKAFITNTDDRFFLITETFKLQNGILLYRLIMQSSQGKIKVYSFYADPIIPINAIVNNDILVGYNTEQNILYYSPNNNLYALNLATADHAMSNLKFLKDASPIDRLLFFIAQLTRHESMRDQLLANPEIYEFILQHGQELFPALYEQLNVSPFLRLDENE